MFEQERVIAEINLDNIAKNIKNIRNAIKKESKIMAVVKADAYGHGCVEVSKACLSSGAEWLGVAILEEAIELRKNNIFEPILVLGNTMESKFEQLIKNDITQTVFSFEMAKKLSDIAKNIGKDVNIHIKIDTGMSRIGFLPNQETIEEIVKISKLPYVNITGVFTHFATSDEENKDFAKEQFEKYMWVIEKLEDRGITNVLKHVSNSGAILDLSEYDLDIVRAGIIIYGIYPSDKVKKEIELFPAMSIKTHIVYIKEIEENTSVGYCRTYFTNKKTKIATVPIGYADGYSRMMSNKGKVIVNGQYANVIGNICMDQFMIDVTHIENVQIGDKVTLIGEENGLFIGADDLAKLQGTISNEIVCGIGKRIPRVFTQNGEIIKIKN